MDLITPDLGLIFWQIVILLFVLFILRRFAWKPILKAIQEREESVESALLTIEDSQKIAAQVQSDKELLLKAANIEREKIIEEAMTAKEKIIEEAKTEAEKLGKRAMEQTRLLLKEEEEKVRTVLRNDVATLSIQIAEKLLRNELQQQSAQVKLVQQLVKEAPWS